MQYQLGRLTESVWGADVNEEMVFRTNKAVILPIIMKLGEYYLDECTFRFNRRTSRSRGMLFYRLMQQAVMTPPLPYRQIVERKHNI